MGIQIKMDPFDKGLNDTAQQKRSLGNVKAEHQAASMQHIPACRLAEEEEEERWCDWEEEEEL